MTRFLKRTITLFVYLDACGYDSISKRGSPTIWELATSGLMKRTCPVAGFCQRTPMLTGTYPQTSNHFARYILSPKASPFTWIRGFPWLRSVANYEAIPSWLALSLKLGIRNLTKLLTRTLDPDPAYIPLDLLPFFDVVDNKVPIEEELRHVPNVFSVCRQSGKRYRYFFPRFPVRWSFSKPYSTARRLLERGDGCDFLMIHEVLLDFIGHGAGIDSARYAHALLWIDQRLEELLKLLRDKYESFNVVIASDHGMVEVKGKIDLRGTLAKLTYRPIRDYLYFLDSTLARFWFLNEQAGKDITRALSNVPHGHILGQSEREGLKINFNHDGYGELLFCTDPGYLISPNFFQPKGEGPRTMHGYVDEVSQQQGMMVVYSSSGEVQEMTPDEPLPLVDVFPTLLTCMGLPIPPTCEGHSAIDI